MGKKTAVLIEHELDEQDAAVLLSWIETRRHRKQRDQASDPTSEH